MGMLPMKPFPKSGLSLKFIASLGLLFALGFLAMHSPARADGAETRVERCARAAALYCQAKLKPGGCPARLCAFLSQENLVSLECVLATDWGQTNSEKPAQIVRIMVPPWCISQSLDSRPGGQDAPFQPPAGRDNNEGLDSDAALNLCGQDELESLCESFAQSLIRCLGSAG